MFNVAETLIKNWDDFNAEFAESATLRDKAMLIPTIYLPWELCDDTYLEWDKHNPMAWPDPTMNMVTHTNCSMHVLITRIVILKALVARIVIFNDKYI